MRIAGALLLILIAGCSEEPSALTLQEKWAKVQALNVQESTVAQLEEQLGAPYRSDDGETKRSRFWYPFEGVTGDDKPETAPMLIVIIDDKGEITSFMRSEPIVRENVPTRIRPREYMVRVGKTWKRGDFKTKEVLSP